MKLVEINSEEIFVKDKFFNECHASTLLKCGSTLICAWFAGTKEGADDVRIYISINRNGKWEEPLQISNTNGFACWNPVLFEYNGVITLFYKSGKKISKWLTYFMTSSDCGKTWCEAKELVPGDNSGGRGPVKNKPILLSDGRIAAPASIETLNRWDSFVDISADGGKTWTKSNLMKFDHRHANGNGIIQPTLWESEGKIYALLRSSESCILVSSSSDGINWNECKKTKLPNNNSGIDCVKLNDGTVIVVFNPIASDWGSRNIIAYAATNDNSDNFSAPHIIEFDDDPAAEFSYPAVITDNEYIYITYTHYRKTIMFRKFRIEK